MKTINLLSNHQVLSQLLMSLCQNGTVPLKNDLLPSDVDFIHSLLTCLDLRHSSTSQEITIGFRNRSEPNLLKEAARLLHNLEENKVHRSNGYFGLSNRIIRFAELLQAYYELPLHIDEHTIKRHEG